MLLYNTPKSMCVCWCHVRKRFSTCKSFTIIKILCLSVFTLWNTDWQTDPMNCFSITHFFFRSTCVCWFRRQSSNRSSSTPSEPLPTISDLRPGTYMYRNMANQILDTNIYFRAAQKSVK